MCLSHIMCSIHPRHTNRMKMDNTQITLNKKAGRAGRSTSNQSSQHCQVAQHPPKRHTPEVNVTHVLTFALTHTHTHTLCAAYTWVHKVTLHQTTHRPQLLQLYRLHLHLCHFLNSLLLLLQAYTAKSHRHHYPHEQHGDETTRRTNARELMSTICSLLCRRAMAAAAAMAGRNSQKCAGYSIYRIP